MTAAASSSHQDLWRRVEQALDERRNPLADPDLLQELGRAPELLIATRKLVQRLAALDAQPQSARSRRGRRIAGVALSAAAGFCAVLAVRGVGREPAAAPPRPPAVTLTVERVTPPAPSGRRVTLAPRHVLGWTLEGR